MTISLPALGELTAHSSTKELLAYLAEQYQARDVGFAQSRLALDAWANRLAVGEGVQSQVEITSPEREVSIAELFCGMNRDQAGRFMGELFNEIVPHVASQDNYFQDIARGHTRSGAPIHRPGLLARMASALSAMSPAQLDEMASTTLRKLTWVDDGMVGIESTATVEVDIRGVSKASKVKF